jgi:hypothetical protein
MGSGGDSATLINTPLEFLIKTPDGVDATDFQLVHLHDKSDAREFRTVTGDASVCPWSGHCWWADCASARMRAS